MNEELRKAALVYHRLPRPGKLKVQPTKRMASQSDLALAYVIEQPADVDVGSIVIRPTTRD